MIVPLLLTLLATAGLSPGAGVPPQAGWQGTARDSVGWVGGDLFTGFS